MAAQLGRVDTALLFAAHNGHHPKAEFLLKRDARPNAANKWGNTEGMDGCWMLKAPEGLGKARRRWFEYTGDQGLIRCASRPHSHMLRRLRVLFGS